MPPFPTTTHTSYVHHGTQVYRVTGVGFISRLLHTTDVPAGCSPDAYQAIAASLLGSFTACPAVAAEPAVLALTEPLLEMLELVPTSPTTPAAAKHGPPQPLSSQTDAAEALAGMAATPEGRACLLRAVADKQLAEFVSRPESQVAAEAAIAGLRGLALLVADRNTASNGSGGGGSGKESVGIRCSGDRVGKAANAMATCFSKRRDGGKLVAAELLLALLDHARGTFEPGTPTFNALAAGNASWPASVGDGLAGLLQSKLGPEVRDMLLQLAALTVEWHGVGWAAAAKIEALGGGVGGGGGGGGVANTATSDTSAPAVLLSLLIELSCIELRMGLEDRSVTDVLENGALITSCYVIVEAAIAATVAFDGATKKLSLEMLERLQQRFAEALQAVMEFLATVKDDQACNLDTDIKAAALVDSSIRVLAMWLAEETAAHRDQLHNVLPFVLARISSSTSSTPPLPHDMLTTPATSATPATPAATAVDAAQPPIPPARSELLRLFLPALYGRNFPPLKCFPFLKVEVTLTGASSPYDGGRCTSTRSDFAVEFKLMCAIRMTSCIKGAT